ncbi:Oxoglutarate/iron-dependent dioxygenase [Parasponia andersonii]|uniref:Oxoglutarate/iron-dependent dioxygenase n=1 Tax=Parasponia andersonii TaxID=3476 RepID=A0A2P5AAP5_PARAD|nr:Oxoglutarate/iron-dependent dioxygenase [Parasponia andersonii]
MSSITEDADEGNKEELTKLDLACEKWGFFQVVNHGVPSEVLQGLKDASAEFFELPLGEKNKVSMRPNDIPGYGHAYVVSEDQIFDWTDTLIMLYHPSRFRNPKIWPTEPRGFKESIEAYLNESKRVAEELLGYLSLVLGMDTVLGLSPHSDTSAMTILKQDDNVAGLQIRHQEGWVPVKPIPNALVVNIGDVIDILSNGKYKSIEHRAVTNKTNARLSHAVFVVPHDEVEIEPLGHFIESHGSISHLRESQIWRVCVALHENENEWKGPHPDGKD